MKFYCHSELKFHSDGSKYFKKYNTQLIFLSFYLESFFCNIDLPKVFTWEKNAFHSYFNMITNYALRY